MIQELQYMYICFVNLLQASVQIQTTTTKCTFKDKFAACTLTPEGKYS